MYFSRKKMDKMTTMKSFKQAKAASRKGYQDRNQQWGFQQPYPQQAPYPQPRMKPNKREKMRHPSKEDNFMSFFSWITSQEDERLDKTITVSQGQIGFGHRRAPLPPSPECIESVFQNTRWVPDWTKMSLLSERYSKRASPIIHNMYKHVAIDMVNVPTEGKKLFFQRMLLSAYSAAFMGKHAEMPPYEMPPYENFPQESCNYICSNDYLRCYGEYLSKGCADLQPIHEIKTDNQGTDALKYQIETMKIENQDLKDQVKTLNHETEKSVLTIQTYEAKNKLQEVELAQHSKTIVHLKKKIGELERANNLLQKKEKSKSGEKTPKETENIPIRIIGQETEPEIVGPIDEVEDEGIEEVMQDVEKQCKRKRK